MIQNIDRVPVNPNRKLITPENGTPFYATVDWADNPVEAGTPINKLKLDEILAASGTTTGTNTALTLEQDGFVLLDGSLVRAKLHTDVLTGATINVNGSGAKTIMDTYGRIAKIIGRADTWITLIYSSTLDKYVLQSDTQNGFLTELVRFTSTGTFDPTTYPSLGGNYLILAVGAGGGGGCGGGSSNNATSAGTGGGGGGAGGVVTAIANITSTINITIGAGSKPTSSDNGMNHSPYGGYTGGYTTVGNIILAPGGGGGGGGTKYLGTTSYNGSDALTNTIVGSGVGGKGSSSNGAGSAGYSGIGAATVRGSDGSYANGGAGAPSAFGAGGTANSGNGTYGSGGGGGKGTAANGGNGSIGGKGGDGLVIIYGWK